MPYQESYREGLLQTVYSFRYQVARKNGKCHLQMLIVGYTDDMFLSLIYPHNYLHSTYHVLSYVVVA